MVTYGPTLAIVGDQRTWLRAPAKCRGSICSEGRYIVALYT